MAGILLVIGIIAVLVGMYIGSYILNKNTAVPEGTPVIDKCSTCGTSGACALQSEDKVEECDTH